ncbi:MAG: hypothetical protein COT91_02365 [Candidatus Doudnabacteria bacterium CG10_big_fil_rev_8_21_14_0_10_41_10]|uniref:Uncharacterized protein n=1 Tax=Candidatus Doudnabacteria bacterium CG10_big_fil_rev_8_21_14_0_10_41_10 TaxID=1974551 RepID=A0A2H0VFX4_9BACT|nr:MAG: hypothetical protein COT91_02365 [Candidatus Doudnabacteria bacterium CG10_big_fil_rev_8_21_14_0_10_41_10]
MVKFKLRARALNLRKQGKSYSQIKNDLGVSKNILSVWFRNLPLSKERVKELRDRNEKRFERFRITMQKKRDKRLKFFYGLEKKSFTFIKQGTLYGWIVSLLGRGDQRASK